METRKSEKKTLSINGRKVWLIKLLGKGKGGYSWLAENDSGRMVIKQIHHEPCSYYTFGNKLESELRDYQILKKAGIPLPEMIEVDSEKERIVKEFIDGPTALDLVLADRMQDELIEQVREMADLLQKQNLNIDYFPTNFVLENGRLFYIDYECNEYMPEWNFENWGIRYWSKTPELAEYLKNQSSDHQNEKNHLEEPES